MLSPYKSCILPYAFLLCPRDFLKCMWIAIVVDIKEFKVSLKVILKLHLILSLIGTQGGCCCVVLQPCAVWDYPALQLGGGPIYTGSPGDRRAGHCCSYCGVWE